MSIEEDQKVKARHFALGWLCVALGVMIAGSAGGIYYESVKLFAATTLSVGAVVIFSAAIVNFVKADS